MKSFIETDSVDKNSNSQNSESIHAFEQTACSASGIKQKCQSKSMTERDDKLFDYGGCGGKHAPGSCPVYAKTAINVRINLKSFCVMLQIESVPGKQHRK